MQSRTETFIEAWLGTAVGFVISLLVQQFVINPLFDLHVNFVGNASIVGIFTVASLLRAYCIRRFFNSRTLKKNENRN